MADIPAYVVVDHILKSENEQITEQNTFNVSFTQLVEGDRDAIADWVKEDLQYSELKNAPALPEDTNGESPAYETIEEERKIKGFKELAFTGEYSDLSGAPGIPAAGFDNGVVKDFDPVAFTGITDLGNVQVSEVLDLRSYSNGVEALGQDSVYIETIPSGLGTAVASFCNKFSLNKGKKPYYIITNAITGGKVYQVLDAQIVGPGGPDGYYYYKIDVASVNTSTYPYVNGTKGQSVLENIEITSKLGCFVFDIVNNCIYYKSENVTADIELPELAEVATTGSYNDLNNIPELSEVALSGNYDDLINQYYIFDPSQFIFEYNNQNESWTILTGHQLLFLQSFGRMNSWLAGLSNLYNLQNNIEENNIIYKLKELEQQFNDGKICYLKSSGSFLLVTSIDSTYVNNALINMTIQTSLVNQTNFSELSGQTPTTSAEVTAILDSIIITLQSPIIIIDFNNGIIYSLLKKVYPVSLSNYGLTVDKDNKIGILISDKANNQLEIIDDPEEGIGLYASS